MCCYMQLSLEWANDSYEVLSGFLHPQYGGGQVSPALISVAVQ
jgi:hypothetical protein